MKDPKQIQRIQARSFVFPCDLHTSGLNMQQGIEGIKGQLFIIKRLLAQIKPNNSRFYTTYGSFAAFARTPIFYIMAWQPAASKLLKISHS